jgi:hypothetical protein
MTGPETNRLTRQHEPDLNELIAMLWERAIGDPRRHNWLDLSVL